jgi:hypothetical protein
MARIFLAAQKRSNPERDGGTIGTTFDSRASKLLEKDVDTQK